MKRCPSCSRDISLQAVICIDCGHDFRSGRRLTESTGPRSASAKPVATTQKGSTSIFRQRGVQATITLALAIVGLLSIALANRLIHAAIDDIDSSENILELMASIMEFIFALGLATPILILVTALSTLAAFSWSSTLLAQEIQTRQFEATVRLALSVIVSIGSVVYWIVVFS